MYIIYNGEVEVTKKTNGEEKVMYLAKRGEILGDISILGKVPRTASLRAKTDVELLLIEDSHFMELLKENPDISIELFKMIVDRYVVPYVK
jgi:CRP-like cAMP-binding protein